MVSVVLSKELCWSSSVQGMGSGLVNFTVVVLQGCLQGFLSVVRISAVLHLINVLTATSSSLLVTSCVLALMSSFFSCCLF
jgi:hypothetical protein